MDVTLHLGAHRTGTTTLQRYLESNRDILGELGIEFLGPKQTRAGLLDGLQKNPNELTDEANLRCKRVVFSVQSYEGYWAPVLPILIKSGRAIPTLQQIHKLAAQPRRWRDVLTEISNVFPAAELVVWSFETMAGRLPDQLALLNGGTAPPQIRGQQNWHNASVGGLKLRQVLIDGGHKALAAKVPKEPTRWQRYDAQQTAEFQKLYGQDIAWLRGWHCQIQRQSTVATRRTNLRPLKI